MLAALISTSLYVPTTFAATESGEGESSSENVAIKDIGDEDTRYNAYLQQIEAAAAQNNTTVEDYDGQDIVLTPSEATPTMYEDTEYQEIQLEEIMGKADVMTWSEMYDSLTWTVNIPKTGYYQISLDYASIPTDKLGINPARGILINGETPFFEAQNMSFKRWWKDEHAPEKNEITDDEKAPDLVEIRKWAEGDLQDTDGYYVRPFKFYLEAGENTITLKYILRDMLMGNVYIGAPDSYQTYAEVSANYSQYDQAGTAIVTKFQAESFDSIVEKTSNMMRLTSSKDTSVTEFRPGYTDMNTVGGSANWYEDRDAYTWKFTVPKDGLYKIALRVANNFNIGMPVYRQISIDGEVPFTELESYKFRYDYNYYTETLSADDGTPYYFYLEAGKEHTISLEVSMGNMGELALAFYSETTNLNNLIRAVKKIVGSDVDPNYNYRIEERVPGLYDSIKNLIVQFNRMIEILKVECETDSSTLINELKTTIETLQECADNPIDIPSKMADLSGIQTSMGSWITTIENSPLQMDYIEICEPAATPSNPKASFLRRLENIWVSFIVSFKKDYNAAYQQISEGEDVDVIEVWLSKDRENADLMMPMIREEFNQNKDKDDPHRFLVNIRIVPGQIDFGGFNLLLLSLMSGQEPDMIWGCGAGTPVQFAIRGYGYNLRQFEDYEEVVQRFSPSTMNVYTYTDNADEDGDGIRDRDGVYAFPETTDIDFYMYRTDVFEEYFGNTALNGKPYTTWEEYYDIYLPVCYKNGLIPMAADTNAWLLQRGGWPYRSDHRLSGNDTELAYEVMVEGFDLYLVHGLDIEVQTFQGFRDGDVPLMSGGLATFIQLNVQAPELMGKWDIAPVAGTIDEYGINNLVNGGGVGGGGLAIMPSTEYADHCWELMKWWTDTDTQIQFSNLVDAKFGMKNRHYSANKEALLSMGWSVKERELIDEMLLWCCNPQTVLGDYQFGRYGGFAFNQVVIQGRNARDAVDEMIEMIHPEVWRKQAQYGITPPTQEEIDSEVYEINQYTQCKYYVQLREEKQKELEAAGKGE